MKSLLTDVIAERFAAICGNRLDRSLQALLAECLRECVKSRELPAGSRLPPTRDLAAHLRISRNTVAGAYDQLRAEGYTRAVTGSGTFLQNDLPDTRAIADTVMVVFTEDARQAGECASLSSRGVAMLDGQRDPPEAFGAFVPGAPDLTRFPRRKFSSLLAKWWRDAPTGALSYAPGGGHMDLRRAISGYLMQARSLSCDAEQVIITDGIQQAVDLIARLLGNPGDVAWTEEPGYWGVRNALRSSGIHPSPMSVDAEGMVVPEVIEKDAAVPRFIFVTPSHQYPLGAVMSVRRRMDLLRLAGSADSWIVEDDYDSEFRFSQLPVLPLYGMSNEGRVIYMGTFSKTLFPGVRVAYMVVPRHLATAFERAQARFYRSGSQLTQLALADFVASGQYASHIRQMRKTYATRREFLLRLIQDALGKEFIHEFDTPAGLHLVLRLPQHIDDVALEAELARRGVQTRALSQYFLDAERIQRGLLLGFAGTALENMLAPFSIVVECIRSALRQASGAQRAAG